MKVEMKLAVEARDFWNIIVDSIRQDAGKEKAIYEGMTFEKQLPTTLSGMVNATIVIVKYEEEKCYSADFITKRSTVHSTYRITEVDGGILVTYEEEETFSSKMDRWNAKIMKFLYKKSRTKKLIRKLINIEKHIKGE